MRRRATLRVCLLAVLALIVGACAGSPSPTPPPPPPLPVTGQPQPGSCGLGPFGDDESAIRAVLEAEGRLVVAQTLPDLMALWDESGAVVDAVHTPDDAGDDQRWDGVDAIRHRYVWLVFPGAPAQASPGQMAVEVDGDMATVTATTQIGDELSPGGDRWELVRTPAGCWVIQQLTFNLER